MMALNHLSSPYCLDQFFHCIFHFLYYSLLKLCGVVRFLCDNYMSSFVHFLCCGQAFYHILDFDDACNIFLSPLFFIFAFMSLPHTFIVFVVLLVFVVCPHYICHIPCFWHVQRYLPCLNFLSAIMYHFYIPCFCKFTLFYGFFLKFALFVIPRMLLLIHFLHVFYPNYRILFVYGLKLKVRH